MSDTDTDTDGTAAEQASIEPTRWVVRPAGIANTRFADPESFYLNIIRSSRRGETVYLVTHGTDQRGFTKNGRSVYLRHDVNAKHARHATFDDAATLARALADGTLVTDEYRFWRTADEQRFGPMPETSNG
jgi:hypothetical protein